MMLDLEIVCSDCEQQGRIVMESACRKRSHGREPRSISPVPDCGTKSYRSPEVREPDGVEGPFPIQLIFIKLDAESRVSIVSNGWSNVRHKPLINVLAVNSRGAMFMYAEDFSGLEKTGVAIANYLLIAIEEVGPSNVLQIITDNAANCKAAGNVIEKGCLCWILGLGSDRCTLWFPNLLGNLDLPMVKLAIVIAGAKNAFKRIAKSQEEEEMLREQFAKFHMKKGLWSMEATQMDAVTMDAIDWWFLYGFETLELAEVLKRCPKWKLLEIRWSGGNGSLYLSFRIIGFLAKGLEKTSAGLGSVIIDSQPLTVAVLASLLFGESISLIGIAGLVLGVVGLALLELPAVSFDENNFSLWGSGEWWMLLAAQSMAVGTVMVRWVSKYSDPVMATGWHMVLGGIPLAAVSFLVHDPALNGGLSELTANDVFALLYTSVFGSAISYGLYFYNATRGSLTKLSSLTFLTPMFASVFG
ncbi:hypothetical protein E3N88_07041 [Mikania micrantha]|uniref:EamA domain-containing protein n=1 Tax=Mikania micrantha TaxID=192012 RepID=A0A5N6PSH5_9ASTR|nr:hypothetical protein E3N88_07041 [Mikania micrantha]